MNNYILKDKTYKIYDYIKIPWRICPLYTFIKIIDKLICALIPSMQVLVTTSFINRALDIFNGSINYNEIYLPLIFLMLLIAFNNLNWQLMSFIDLKFEMCMTKEYHTAIVEKRARLEYRHIENNDTWDLVTRTCKESVVKITNGLNKVLEAVEITIHILSLLIILAMQVWWAGIVVLLFSVPMFKVSLKAGKISYEANKEAEKYIRRATYLQRILQHRDTVEERTLFRYTDNINKQWYEKYETARKINVKRELKNFIRMKGSSLITVAISLGIIAVLLYPVSTGKTSIGMFMALVSATLNLVQIMSWQFSWIMNELAKSKEYLTDLSAFSGLSETEGGIDLPINKTNFNFKSIIFNNVSFQYPGTEKYILKNFSLTLEENKHYAFVGINGAGKTTITKLLTGLYDNYEGEIKINDIDLRTYSQAELKSIFSVVYQDFAKYSISVKDNISIGNLLACDTEEINKVIVESGFDKAIKKLPEGIDTSLGKIKKDGVDLSGGEWQRVAIARALYNPAQIRILDEPTAALDPISESNIYKIFGRMTVGKSTIFITHRLGAARLAHEIIVLDQGCVKEQGSHDTLIKQNGIYANMFEAQRSWYKDEE